MTVEAVLRALAGVDGPVRVTGDDPLAREVRAALGSRAQESAAPAAVVDTTGDAGALDAALAGVATLGTVVLAGPEPPTGVPLDLYADLHVRGLVVVGVPGRARG